MSSTLSIDVALTLETDGVSFSVWSADDRILVNAPSFRSLSRLRSLFDRLQPLFSQMTRSGRDPFSVLPPIEIQVRRAPVVRLHGLPTDRSLWSIVRTNEATVLPTGIVTAVLRGLG